MLLNREYLMSAKTTVNSMLLHIARDKMVEVAKQNFAFAQELMASVGRQFYTLMRDIESYSLQTARQWLAGYLLR